MIKKTLLGILLMGIIVLIGFFVFMANFEIFDEPTETELKVECDYEGLRKISMYELSGNASTSNSIIIKSSDCNVDQYSNELINSEIIFAASSSNINKSDVKFEWKSFDTLTIRYNKNLKVFNQEPESKTVNPKIIFEYITE